MPDRSAVLAERYRDALIAIRKRVSTRVEANWRALGSWDQADVPRFLDATLPVVEAGQRRTVSLTDAYLSRVSGTRAVGLNAADLIGAAVRNGTEPATVYTRPFIQHWAAIKSGTDFTASVSAAGVRAGQSAATDISLTMRDTATEFQNESPEMDSEIVGWERVLDPDACAFCAAASTRRYEYPNPTRVVAFQVKFNVDDGWPLHNNCQCSIAPVFAENDKAIQAFNERVLSNIKEANAGRDTAYWNARHFRVDGQTGDIIEPRVAVREHGELGPVITDASHNFTGPDDVPSSPSPPAEPDVTFGPSGSAP